MHMQFKCQTFMLLLVLSFLFFSLVTKNNTIFTIVISVRDELTIPTWPSSSKINGRDKNTNISAGLHTAVITYTCDLTWKSKKEHTLVINHSIAKNVRKPLDKQLIWEDMKWRYMWKKSHTVALSVKRSSIAWRIWRGIKPHIPAQQTKDQQALRIQSLLIKPKHWSWKNIRQNPVIHERTPPKSMIL